MANNHAIMSSSPCHSLLLTIPSVALCIIIRYFLHHKTYGFKAKHSITICNTKPYPQPIFLAIFQRFIIHEMLQTILAR